MRSLLLMLSLMAMSPALFAQTPPPDIVGPGVSQELARWRATRYSDVRYKLNLTLEKMSPVLKGSMEIRVRVSGGAKAETRPVGSVPPIILDWRKIKGYEDRSVVTNVSINGKAALSSASITTPSAAQKASGIHPSLNEEGSFEKPPKGETQNVYHDLNEHLIFRDGVVVGENVIKLDFTSPILPSGSAITRYVDKEDGSEYIYSLFVPSDASTAFPVFDQPDLKARFDVAIMAPDVRIRSYPETKPISTYVFAFAAGPWEKVSMVSGEGGNLSGSEGCPIKQRPIGHTPYRSCFRLDPAENQRQIRHRHPAADPGRPGRAEAAD